MVILSGHVPNNIASKHLQQKVTETKGEVDKATITVEDFDTFFSVMDKTSGPKALAKI